MTETNQTNINEQETENNQNDSSTESSETSATDSVEPNAYRQTPAIALVGGIVRRVIPELGQNVSAG